MQKPINYCSHCSNYSIHDLDDQHPQHIGKEQSVCNSPQWYWRDYILPVFSPCTKEQMLEGFHNYQYTKRCVTKHSNCWDNQKYPAYWGEQNSVCQLRPYRTDEQKLEDLRCIVKDYLNVSTCECAGCCEDHLPAASVCIALELELYDE